MVQTRVNTSERQINNRKTKIMKKDEVQLGFIKHKIYKKRSSNYKR